ncbi:lipopolysaccharide biosynthesis protein [Novosphingobium sp.]|uniref:lipopolysaccharide biosynthesis protein n=1 Tax=Novosphingobium sp. TaxID=1874826 RepID=UPI0025EDE844|nr:lipopolysaccharide biosynthesis protein [Novosphingobium sp.]
MLAVPPAESLKRRSLEGAAVMTASQIVRIVLQLGSQIVLARLLYAADFGLLAMVMPMVSFIQIFADIGFAQGIVQRAELTRARVSALFWLNLALSLIVALLVAASGPIAVWIYHEPRVLPVMLVFACIVPIGALQVLPNALLTRQMRFRALGLTEVATSLTSITATIVLALHGWGVWSLVYGQLAGAVVSTAINWLACRWLPSAPRRFSGLLEDVKFGSGLLGSNLAVFLIQSGDNMIVGITTGTEALGLYDRSYRLVAQPLGQLVAPIGRVAVPLLARLVGRPEVYARTYLDLFRALALLTMPLMLVCIFNADAVITLLFGPRWAAAAPVFGWVCVGGLTSAVYGSIAWLFISQARTHEMMRMNLVVMVISFVSFFIGSRWGVAGVAAGGAIGFVLIATPLNFRAVTRVGPIARRDIAFAAAPIAIQALIAGLLLVMQRKLGWTGPTQLLAALGVAYLTFAVSALLVPGQRKIVGHLVDIARMARGVALSASAKSGRNTGVDDLPDPEQQR